MTRATDLHDTHSAAVLEQITRWAVADNWNDELSGETQQAVRAAETAGREHFAGTLAALAEHDGHGSRAAMLHATLQGNVDLIGHALADNEGLRSLYRTTAERAQGIDMAEIATPNGLRLRAKQTGEAYQTAVLVEDASGRSDVLASDTITAATATDALRTAAQHEHAVHGLDRTDLHQVDQQLTRLDVLTHVTSAANPYTGNSETYDMVRQQRQLERDVDAGYYRAFAEALEPGGHWAEEVTQVTGRDLRGEPGWATLAATLDRAAAAGWDVAGQLPAAVAQAPLPTHGSVSQDLACRVMDACPDAVPPAPSVAQINGTEPASTGRQREAAERAIRPTPAPDRGPTVGR